MNEQDDFIKSSVVLWGPKGSGKTSLIYAFAKVINSKYAFHQDDLSYTLLDPETKTKIFSLPPDMIPEIRDGSKRATITNRIFSRISRDDKHLAIWKKIMLNISSCNHQVAFCDDSGGNLVKLVQQNALSTDHKLQSAWVRFKNAKNIVILLDPSLLTENDSESDLDTPRYSRNAYLGFAQSLCQKLEKEQPIQRRVAVCLTKSDELDPGSVAQALDHEEAAWNLIAEEFGEHMRELFNKQFHQFQIKPFVVSAKKAHVNEWEPMGVEFPFFWMFEESEIEFLFKRLSNLLGQPAENSNIARKLMNMATDFAYTRYPKKYV